MDDLAVRELIYLLIIILAFIALYNSVPAGKVKELFDKARETAGKTESPIDDLAVDIGEKIAEVIMLKLVESSSENSLVSVKSDTIQNNEAHIS